MISAPMNFAADRSQGGVWSNFAPETRTQALTSIPVHLEDARTMPMAPSLDREGFVCVRAPVADPDWRNPDWVDGTYIPGCVELVRQLTGGAVAAPFHAGVLIRDSARRDGAPAADFVHLDNSVEGGARFVERAFSPDVLAGYKRAQVFNIWRAITPPPQDVPLALCDQRTVDQHDWVVGETIEPGFDPAPYVISLVNPAQRWFYFSDLAPDEAIVFKGYDSDPNAPFGCLHGAFRHPEPGAVSEPRASAEARIVVLS